MGKRGLDNSILKGLRIFFVTLSWVVVVTTSMTSMELLRATLLFSLGLLYDYLCLYDAAKDLWFQRALSIIGLMAIGLIGLIEACGFLGILQQAVENPKVLVMISSSNILNHLTISTTSISWLLLIFPCIAWLEFMSMFFRKSTYYSLTERGGFQ